MTADFNFNPFVSVIRIGRENITAVGFKYIEITNKIKAVTKNLVLPIRRYCLERVALSINIPKDINTGSINKYLENPKPSGEKPSSTTTNTENILFFKIA